MVEEITIKFETKVQVMGEGALITTIPFLLARVLHLKKGDVVVWSLKKAGKGRALLLEKKQGD